MKTFRDGPSSRYFKPLKFSRGIEFADLPNKGLSQEFLNLIQFAPEGECVSWGIPFNVEQVVCLKDQPCSIDFDTFQAKWLVFMHTSDIRPIDLNRDGFALPTRGYGHLGEVAAIYYINYSDGTEEKVEIRRRFQIGPVFRNWGENCFEAVAHHKPFPVSAGFEHETKNWAISLTRNNQADEWPWINWLWAWKNPHPEKDIVKIKFEPVFGAVIVSAISAGMVSDHPLRWQPRKKAVVRLPEGVEFRPNLDEHGLLSQIQIDLGQVISASPRMEYGNESWTELPENDLPEYRKDEILIEYSAHEEASIHLPGNTIIPLNEISEAEHKNLITSVSAADKKVHLRIVEKDSGKKTAVKLHMHGEWGEYLAPIDRQRIVNPSWLEDLSADSSLSPKNDIMHHHPGCYIDGDTQVRLPLGKVYFEITKGFEILPIHKVIEIKPETEEVVFEIEKVLPWREKGWVTADTHVHFLSPVTALLEGAAEGVNVVNLLATQWGEFITNAADFDGKTTWGSKEAGGDGEYLVRVGSENRQHVLGHISLLGYQGRLITPLTTGGPDESAIGDPIEVAMIEWAQQCKVQGGLVVLPHFPNPRAEFAAGIVDNDYDAVEMKTYRYPDRGILPYALSDWYRFLNCGYFVPIVGGTDKMSAATAVGMIRTYAKIPVDVEFTYESWMQAVKKGETFATVGPLLEFTVNGKNMGNWIHLPESGGTLDIEWQIASVSMPATKVELVVNGVIVENQTPQGPQEAGHWSLKVDHSSWLALLVRGHYPGQSEVIAAHSSPVMVQVEGSEFRSAADELTILEQIEGALAYLDSVGSRADEMTYKRMRIKIENVYQRIHNRMHRNGYFHSHTPVTKHQER